MSQSEKQDKLKKQLTGQAQIQQLAARVRRLELVSDSNAEEIQKYLSVVESKINVLKFVVSDIVANNVSKLSDSEAINWDIYIDKVTEMYDELDRAEAAAAELAEENEKKAAEAKEEAESTTNQFGEPKDAIIFGGS